jgi:hypothetical protein
MKRQHCGALESVHISERGANEDNSYINDINDKVEVKSKREGGAL